MSHAPITPPHAPEYAWELATLYPEQGYWSEEAYLDLTDGTNKRVEFIDGRLAFLPMPTELHQELVAFLYRALYQFVQHHGIGKVQFSGLRVRIRPGNIREPDILFLNKERYHLRHNHAWDGADLVMEVVSPDPKDRRRDYEDKLVDYAEAGIAEYWIVDPQRRVVIVNRLQDAKYTVHGEFESGSQAISCLLPEFSVEVAALFAVIDEIAE